jgi:hypothetical protein
MRGFFSGLLASSWLLFQCGAPVVLALDVIEKQGGFRSQHPVDAVDFFEYQVAYLIQAL